MNQQAIEDFWLRANQGEENPTDVLVFVYLLQLYLSPLVLGKLYFAVQGNNEVWLQWLKNGLEERPIFVERYAFEPKIEGPYGHPVFWYVKESGKYTEKGLYWRMLSELGRAVIKINREININGRHYTSSQR